MSIWMDPHGRLHDTEQGNQFVEKGDVAGLSALLANNLSIETKLGIKENVDKTSYKTSYSYISRQTMDGSLESQRAKDYILTQGRGLGKADKLTKEQEEVLGIIDQKSVELEEDMLLHRTDDSHWLEDSSVGDIKPIQNIMMASRDSRIVIPENEGKVIQELYIRAPKGTRVFAPGAGSEEEIDIVRGQRYRINEKTYDRINRKFIYTLQMLR